MSYISPDLKLGTRDFSAGFLDTPEPDTLNPGATPDAKNAFLFGVEISEKRRARMGRRKGCRLVNPTATVAAKKVDGLWEFRRESAAGQLLEAVNGAWYLFDEINAFSAIASATGYSAGSSARIVIFKNQAILHDGTKQQIYDGTSARDIGFVKPTGVTNLTTAAGPGVTGTYSARYTWYDQTHDHESSAADSATASQAFANQKRVHTKPAGAPPANVTHWRAYVRREDTSEAYWFRVGTVAIGTATLTESVSDDVRVDRLPTQVAANDPPAVTFALMAVWQGYAIGFESNSSSMHVSAQGDIESWNPSDVFKVSAGDGKGVRCVKAFGTELLIQKPHKSWHLVGTRVPFDIEDLQGSYGNVSQEAGLEVGGRFYGWDEVKGPYWTDIGANWVTIGDLTIANVLKNVNRQALDDIRAVHDEVNNLIIWAVPTIGSVRKRTLLAYHYQLGVWLPPITGMEYGALTQYTTNAGVLGVYFGDYWGRVYQLFQTDREGLPVSPSNLTKQGTVTAATANTLTDSGATFYVTGSGLAGMPVAVRSPAGIWQWRRIASNTGTQLTLDTTNGTPWTTVPAATGWTYIIAGIEWYWTTPILDGGDPGRQKRAHWLSIQQTPAAGNYTFDVFGRFGNTSTDLQQQFRTEAAGALWGEAVWGTSLWSGNARSRPMSKLRLMRSPFSMAFRFQNFCPDQPVELLGYNVGCDWLTRRSVRGAA